MIYIFGKCFLTFSHKTMTYYSLIIAVVWILLLLQHLRMRDLLYVHRTFMFLLGFFLKEEQFFVLFEFAEFPGLLYFSHSLIMWCNACAYAKLNLCFFWLSLVPFFGSIPYENAMATIRYISI